jgi:hypothetical protein
MKERLSIEFIRRAWDSVTSELEMGACSRCGTVGKCVDIGCDNKKCNRAHYLCEFCFIDGAHKGVITPNSESSDEDKEDTKALLEGILFGGEEHE